MLKIVASLLVIYSLVVIGLFIWQRQLLYLPEKAVPTPSEWRAADMQVVRLTTADGLQLSAWYKAATPGQPTLLYFHGNAGHLGYRVAALRPYLQQGYGVLLVSYRGYGGNAGRPSERGLYLDARAAMAFLAQQQIPYHCIVVYGESLGSAVATYVAAHFPVAAVILQAPFNRLADVAAVHYPWLPTRWLLHDRFNAQQYMRTIAAPVLILHGSDDDVVPMELSQKLFAAVNSPKQYLTYDGAAHNDLDTLQLYQAVVQFLDSQQVCSGHNSR